MSITGERLKLRRKNLGMSADEVAAELNVSRSTIFRYESGHIEKVPANILDDLADILRTTPAYLMGWTDDPHDWDRIGNDEGIYPPKDYEGTYEEYVKRKMMQESDDLIDDFYSTYDGATKYLKSLDCNVTEIHGTNDISVVTPNGENLKVCIDDLVYNYKIFGASNPGIKKITAPRTPINVVPVAPTTVRVPILGVIACGEPILAEENIEGYRYESPDLLPGGNVFFLRAKGDSMQPTIPSNSFVLIREQSEVEYGEIAAVLVNEDTEATLKRVKKQGDLIMLMPDNPKYAPIIITSNNPARIIGKAVRYVQDL